MTSIQHVIQAARRVTVLAGALQQAKQERDQTIRAAASNGASVAELIEASGLARAQVYRAKGKQ